MSDKGFPTGATWDALGQPPAYPEDPSAVRGVAEIQTHISRVYLTADRVYKFRKDVHLHFVDFRARDERDADCLREVTLNRRLASDVYLGVASLLGSGDGARVGPVSEALGPGGCEHCVVMRRLPDGRDGLSLLLAGKLLASDLEATAGVIAAFHAAHPAAPDPAGWVEACAAPFRDSLALLGGAGVPGIGAERLTQVREAADATGAALAGALRERCDGGRAVDGHGDLQLAHLWFEHEGRPPAVIDCVEFNAGLREIDAASEVAFLAMDLAYRRRPDLAERFLAAYAAAADDFDLYRVIDWFAAYRAAVRASVAAVGAADPAIGGDQRERAALSARSHFELCEDLLAPRACPGVVVLCGTVGSGKTTVAHAVADARGGVVISSDAIRRTASQRAAEGESERERYAPERLDAVYQAMLACAEPVRASGRLVVLDATHASARRRERVRAWAHGHGLPALLLEVRCAPAEASARLARRAAAGTDASEAGPERLAASRAEFEAPDEWPSEAHLVFEGEPAGAVPRVAAWLERTGGSP